MMWRLVKTMQNQPENVAKISMFFILINFIYNEGDVFYKIFLISPFIFFYVNSQFEYKDFDKSIFDLHNAAGVKHNKDMHFFVKKLYEKNALKMLDSPGSDHFIPKIIHFIWLGGDFPRYLFFCINSWKKMHPDWKIILWDDEKAFKLSKINQFLYDSVSNLGSKADILRLEILQQYGGVYIDTDHFCLKPIDDLLKFKYFHSTESIGNTIINNGIIGCTSNHYIINDMINEIHTKRIDESKLSSKASEDILNLAGPWFINNFFVSKYSENNNYFGEQEIILPPTYFCPFHRELSEHFWGGALSLYELIKKYTFPESYAVHLWNNSWVNGNSRICAILRILESRRAICKSCNIGDCINLKNNKGQTALIEAVINWRQSEIEELLRNGCDYNIKDDNGFAAIDYAQINKNFYLFEPYIALQ